MTVAAKHTPGPWYFSRMERPPIGRQPNGDPWPTDANGNVFWGYSIGGRSENGAAILPTLAAVHNFPDAIDANAHLIAAAPELLEALIVARAYVLQAVNDDGGIDNCEIGDKLALDHIDRAISKAGGTND